MTENKIDSLPRAQCPTEEDEIWPRGEVDYPRRKFLPCEDTPVELVYNLIFYCNYFIVSLPLG